MKRFFNYKTVMTVFLAAVLALGILSPCTASAQRRHWRYHRYVRHERRERRNEHYRYYWKHHYYPYRVVYRPHYGQGYWMWRHGIHVWIRL